MPRYSNRMSIANWTTHLKKKQRGLLPIRKFSIVYKHYSHRQGNCIYVGVSHTPLTRPQEYLRNPRNVCPRTGRAHNFVNYKVFTGASRKIDAYDEECKVYHTMPDEYQRRHDHPAKPSGIHRRCQVRNCRHWGILRLLNLHGPPSARMWIKGYP